MTKTLIRRLQRLEEMIVPKHGPPRIIYVTNVVEEDQEEGPGLVRLSSSLWAWVIGAPLTPEEIRNLREEYNGEQK